MTNLEKYEKVFCETFEVAKSQLNEQFTFKEIEEWNSMIHISLVASLEDEFDVLFDAEDVLNWESYLNGIKILEKYGISFDE